jgi:predicted acetyltransferase
MTLEIFVASEQDKPIVRRMLELYQYDLSPFANADLNEHGEFGYAYLDHYWTENGRYPFLAKLAGKFVGFALVNTHHYLPESEYSMAEFFVLQRYRRQGLGQKFAVHVFEQHCGTWEVRQLPGNVRATSFWKRIIGDYTAGAFKEIAEGHGEWKGPILQFTNVASANQALQATRYPRA